MVGGTGEREGGKALSSRPRLASAAMAVTRSPQPSREEGGSGRSQEEG